MQVGDTVYFHVTNIEQDWDILHGFAVLGAENVGADHAAGRDADAQVGPESAGVYPFYCTDFCSALHQEMQGYVRVVAAGSTVPLDARRSSKKAQSQLDTASRREGANAANDTAIASQPRH